MVKFSPIKYITVERPYGGHANLRERYGASGIGHLSMLKGAIHNNNRTDITSHQTQLIGWVGSLTHLDDRARQDFVSRVEVLPETSKDNECIIL